MIQKIFLIILLSLFLLPLPVLAQNGLLPCGPGTGKEVCSICDLFVLITNILDLVFKVISVLAPLMLIIGGIWFYFSGASPEQKRRAQAIITSAVVGMVIILAAWVVVNTILQGSGIVEMKDGWKWYDIECQVEEETE